MMRRTCSALLLGGMLWTCGGCGKTSTGPQSPGQPQAGVPDLVVDSLAVAPPVPHTSTPIAVSVRLANAGTAAATQAVVVLRVDGAEEDRAVLDVAPGTRTTVQFAFFTLAAGSHQVEVVAGPAAGETDTSDNQAGPTLLEVVAGPVPQALPVAVATAEPASVELGGQVILRGEESRDPAGGRLVFHWTQLPDNPSPVSLPAGDAETAAAVPVSLGKLGTYGFVLVVEDEQGRQSAPDTVAVQVRPPDLVADLPGGATMVFVWIGPGTFAMGSPDSDPLAQADEKPQHQVTITRGFYLGKYELTQGQWTAVMAAQPWTRQSNAQDDPADPAVYISWEDVQEFILRLNAAADDSLYRLPSEAEWEYACRAGTTTPWSFGDDEAQLGNYAWYSANTWKAGESYAHPVGTKQPNPWGLYDMHGNVWEWCQDWYGNYQGVPQTDPTGPDFETRYIVRGGIFLDLAGGTRSASRGLYAPTYRSPGIGVRLVRIR